MIKIGKIVIEEKNTSKGKNKVKYFSLGINGFQQKYIRDKNKYLLKYVFEGDIAYNPMGFDGKVVGFFNKDVGLISSSYFVIRGIKDKVNKKYLFYFFKSHKFYKLIFGNKRGGIRERLYLNELFNLNISIPSLEQQTLIADHLTAVDSALTATDKYIKKLQAVKKGMMTELLTPKDGRETKTLGEVCEIMFGKRNANEGGEGRYKFFTCSKKIPRIKTFKYDLECLITPGNGDLGFVYYFKGEFDAYQKTYILHNFKYINTLFLKYKLEDTLQGVIKTEVNSNTISFLKMSPLKNTFIRYPKDLKEQEEIVRRLNAIESEIEKQKKWRDKMSNVKKGLLNHYFG